ncbi:MAG: NTP transferase domain-containing protein [bacterium]|uniref:Bifunctional protein GlmU n=1 Tax=Gimesia chilikensis TaxID=2605989 RepID=A0A517PTK3_9PLAN|nr:NTP transferase domain-containing protein [Gimesia chilikensis]MCR9234537.1 NTP transferase domain-containing protein [bacterium]QDT22709.1 Bifunctional protein GlmU [Gimesia chilikensis]
MSAPAAVILAAGKSTRMKSELPKVLHPILGRPMIDYVLDAARAAGCEKIVVIVGHKAEEVKAALSHHPDVEFALQADQKGTGHAVMMSADNLAEHDGPVLVLAGDTPLLKGSSLSRLLEVQQQQNAACVVGTAITEANEGLGRIVRDTNGSFLRIVEQKDATPEEAAILEINTGCFAFDGRQLFKALNQVRPNNNQAEYYLTDCAEILLKDGETVLAETAFTIQEALGVNTQEQLAEVADILQQETA